MGGRSRSVLHVCTGPHRPPRVRTTPVPCEPPATLRRTCGTIDPTDFSNPIGDAHVRDPPSRSHLVGTPRDRFGRGLSHVVGGVLVAARLLVGADGIVERAHEPRGTRRSRTRGVFLHGALGGAGPGRGAAGAARRPRRGHRRPRRGGGGGGPPRPRGFRGGP